ncbi:MAG: hypothetical protein ACM3UY_01975 [Methanocella sp.]|jgi:hypothetical protein
MSEPDYPYPKKKNEPTEAPEKKAPAGTPPLIPTTPDVPPGLPQNLPPAQTKRKGHKT